jgi:hypothetical protein
MGLVTRHGRRLIIEDHNYYACVIVDGVNWSRDACMDERRVTNRRHYDVFDSSVG